MKRILIIYRVDKDDPSNHGVILKLIGQKNALFALGHQVDIVIHGSNHVYINDRTWKQVKMASYINRFLFYDHIRDIAKDQIFDIVLLRYGLSTPGFIKWLKLVKKYHPQSKVIIDMPTYPYDKEYNRWRGRLALLIDKYYSKRLKQYVDEMWHSGAEKEVFGISTKKLSNGIDWTEEQVKIHPRKKPITDTFHLVAVAKWQYWHGLDRILKGMAEFNKEHSGIVRAVLTVIGEGAELERLKKLADRLDISPQLKWKGVLTGQALQEYIDKAHVGIGTLGLHRKGVMIDSSLKHREYCLQGIPFVLSSKDEDFGEELDFVHYVAADEIKIDISRLLDFYNGLPEDISQQMIQYAYEKLRWVSKLKPLLA